MQPAVSLITLGVADVARSSAFYDRLGWKRSSVGDASVTFYKLGPLVLSLFDRHALNADVGTPIAADVGESVAAPIRMTLAQNVASPEAVIQVLADAERAGAAIVKPGQATFWGGFAGFFADPDGHLWEIAHNPFFALDDGGQLRLPD